MLERALRHVPRKRSRGSLIGPKLSRSVRMVDWIIASLPGLMRLMERMKPDSIAGPQIGRCGGNRGRHGML